MNENRTSTQPGKYLTLMIGSERYGVGILQVQEIISVPTISHVPRCPDYIKGVINLRGEVIPVIELRTKLGLSRVEYDGKTCIVVLKLGSGKRQVRVGIIVDTVVEVVDYESCEIDPPPAAVANDGYIRGIGKKQDGSLCILLELEQLLEVDGVQGRWQQHGEGVESVPHPAG